MEIMGNGRKLFFLKFLCEFLFLGLENVDVQRPEMIFPNTFVALICFSLILKGEMKLGIE